MVLKEVFGTLYPALEDGTMDRLLHCAKVMQLSKGQVLIEAGDLPPYVFILEEGILRGYLPSAGGKDVTDCFFHRYGTVISGRSNLNAPSLLRVEALTPCRVMMIPAQEVRELMSKDMVMVLAYNQVLARALDRHWEEKLLLHRCAAMERYLWFLKEYPGLIDQVNNRYIASFLNMTPVTLSRLRRQIRENEAAENEAAEIESK